MAAEVPRARKWVKPLLLVALALALLYGGVVLFEDRFIYFPERSVGATPAGAGLAYEDVFFRTEDGVRIHGWFVPGGGDALTLLWFHGNGGNLGHRVETLELLHDELGVDVLMIDYRGYGRSEGRPSEEGLHLDARAALETLLGRRGQDASRVVLFGQSLGAAVAVRLATETEVGAVILEAAFTSIPDLARELYGGLPVGALLRTRFDSEARIARLDVPVLLLHGERDEIVPLEMGERLFAAAREPKHFEVITGARHNDVYLAEGYADALRGFLEGLER